MAWVAVGTAAVGVGASIYGQIHANKQQKKAEIYNKARIQQADNWFRENYYKDYMESDIARGTLEKLSKRFRDSNEANANTSVAGGGTPEAVIANAEQTQNQMNNATLSLASAGQQWKDNLDVMHQNQLTPLQNNEQSILNNGVAQWGNFQSSVGDATAGVLNAWAYGGFDKIPKVPAITVG